MSALKPWPRDAVIVAADFPALADRSQMADPQPRTCGDCGRKVLCCSLSLARAEALPSRLGRPVRFLCPACCGRYDWATIEDLYDDRGREPPF